MFHWLGTGKVASLPWTQRAWLGPRWMIQLWLSARRPLWATDFCFAALLYTPTSILLAWLEAGYFFCFAISSRLQRHQGELTQQEGRGLCSCTRVLGRDQSRLGKTSWAHCVNGRRAFPTTTRQRTVTFILKLQFSVINVVCRLKIRTIKAKVINPSSVNYK